MSPLVVFILFFVFLLIAIPISVSLGLVAVLPGVFDPSFTASLCLVESTVSHSLQYRCLFYPVSLWQEVESQKDFLIYFHFSLENVQQVCHVRQ